MPKFREDEVRAIERIARERDEARRELEVAVAQRDELGIRCAEAQRKAEVLARQVERIQSDRDELAGHATDLQNRLDEARRELEDARDEESRARNDECQAVSERDDLRAKLDGVRAERDALRRHYAAAAPEHNLLALLDHYMGEVRRLEDELEARASASAE